MQSGCKYGVNIRLMSLTLSISLALVLLQGSAAAPIARSVLDFFLDFDIPLFELYGMSESTGPQTLSLLGMFSLSLSLSLSPPSLPPSSPPSSPSLISFSPTGNHRTGSTGKVMAGAEMKIDNPDEKGDGEICFRGRHVFMGYLNEERKTREAIDEDGWLHSGDIGRVDKDGMVKVPINAHL